MFKRHLILLALIIFSLVPTQQNEEIDPEALKDPEFLALLNNYFGCKTWDNGICVACSDRYYFNKNGVCC